MGSSTALLPSHSNDNGKMANNGSVDRHQQQQRIYLLDEHGTHNYSDGPIRPCRVWRPDRGSSVWEIKRRKRLVRLAALGGTIALGIGLLLLLWLLNIPNPHPQAPVTNSSTISTPNVAISRTTSTSSTVTSNLITSQPISILNTSTIAQYTSTTTRPQKLRLSILQPSGTSRRPSFGKKLVQLHSQPTHSIQRHHQKIIRVTAPARAIEFDRMDMKKGEKKSQRVWALLDKGGESGTVPATTPTTTSTTPTTRTTMASTTPTTTLATVPTTTAIVASSLDGIDALKSSKNSSEEGRRAEEEDDDLFWMREKPKHPTPLHTKQMPIIFNHDAYESKRPTIEFAPVRAKDESASMEIEIRTTTTKPMEFKLTNRPMEEAKTTTGSPPNDDFLQEELNEIIESVEREMPSSRIPTSSLEIRPVEIPFGEPMLRPSQSPESVPIWRRQPPDESEEWSPSPPPPPPHPFRVPQVIAKTKNNLNLMRKRREAPVLVTALLDIGRDKWERFTRHIDEYLDYLKNILDRLQNNIVIFCDHSVAAQLRALGNQLDWERIQIVETSLEELPFYRYRNEIEAIMRWEQENWDGKWDQQMRAHPETLYPDYDILVNSKPYFLYKATQISQFPRTVGRSEQFFAWIDAGYGHGSKTAIPEGVWSPQLKTGQITLVKLPTLLEERYPLDRVYRKQRSVISGGFLAGDDRVIKRFWTFYKKTFLELLDQRKIDDDQTTLLVTIQSYNSTFNLLRGGWFDAFKLLSSTQQHGNALSPPSPS